MAILDCEGVSLPTPNTTPGTSINRPHRRSSKINLPLVDDDYCITGDIGGSGRLCRWSGDGVSFFTQVRRIVSYRIISFDSFFAVALDLCVVD